MKIKIIYNDKIKNFLKSSQTHTDVFDNRSEKIELEDENLDFCKKQITKWIVQGFIEHRTKNKEWLYVPIQSILKIIMTEE